MAKTGARGWRRIFNAIGYSWLGFKAAWQHESAFRQELVLSAVLIPTAFFIGQNPLQIAGLIAVLALVLITELINSAIEAVVDRIGDEHNELAGRAKDLASAAVFVSLVLVVVVWALVIAHNYCVMS